jgi:hypothetical protein
MTTSDRERPAPLGDLVSAFHELAGEVRAMRLAVEGRRYRTELLVRLSTAIGLGTTWAGAQQLAQVLLGASDPPAGSEQLVELLQRHGRCPRSDKQLWLILKAAAAAAVTDRNREVCQWPPLGSNASTPPDDRIEP